jgi:hypothetical protein
MSIRTFLADALSTTRIFHLAFERQVAKIKISKMSLSIFCNLIKIRTFDSPYNTRVWCNEINKWSDDICVAYLNISRDKTNKHELFKWMRYDNDLFFTEDYVDECIYEWTRREYRGLAYRRFDPASTRKKSLKVMSRIASDICAGRFVTVDDYI